MRCRSGNEIEVAPVVLGIALAMGAAAAAGTVHVDVVAPDGGDGMRWETAFNDLGVALAAAAPGDEVWVALGTYVPVGDRDATFRLRTAVAVFGGFAGDEKTREERDWVLNPTTLSGDRNGDDGDQFENNGENCRHVVDASGVDTLLDGFTIVGGNADSPSAFGGGVVAFDATLSVRNCTLLRNKAAGRGGGIYGERSVLVLEGCALIDNRGGVGGGLRCDLGSVQATDCSFIENGANAAGGGAATFGATSAVFTRCVFRRNFAQSIDLGYGGGVLLADGKEAVLRDCRFADNIAGTWGGGALVVDATMINCAFSRNEADLGAGAFAEGTSTVSGCTFGRNHGSGLIVAYGHSEAEIVNSIFWGNEAEEIHGSGDRTVTYSNVEGGHSGQGNIDEDPLFAQVGTDDLRLSFGSPCVDVGSNADVPPGVEFDLAGNPRIQGGTVDMGAYEGEYDPGPIRAEDRDVDDDETVLLVPNGGGYDPERNLLVVFRNLSGEDGAQVSVTQYEETRHPDARGFSVLGDAAHLETSVEDGAFFARVSIPFIEEDLGGVDPLALDLTYFDEGVGNWALATGRNTEPSPGHRGVFGDRIVRVHPEVWGTTLHLGDYGVYFDDRTGRGFVWANVDHAAEFTLGLALCPADAKQPPDSFIDFDDLLAVIDNWGQGAGPFDVNNDGTVDVDDVFAVLSAWGVCE